MPLQYLTINSTTFPLSSSGVPGASAPIAVFDTGTTLILGPSDDVDRFWQSVGASRKTDDGWQVRCDRGVSIGFVLGEGAGQKEYVLDPADLSWLQGLRDGDWCFGGVQANDGVCVQFTLYVLLRGSCRMPNIIPGFVWRLASRRYVPSSKSTPSNQI